MLAGASTVQTHSLQADPLRGCYFETESIQLMGTAGLEVGAGEEWQVGYSLLALVTQVGAFWEMQLSLRLMQHVILLTAGG